jgi:hypothetical protein
MERSAYALPLPYSFFFNKVSMSSTFMTDDRWLCPVCGMQFTFFLMNFWTLETPVTL